MYHFGLTVGDSDDELRDAWERLTEAGVHVVGASDHTITHSRYIEDPDGNEIELSIDVQPEVWRDDPMTVFAPIKPRVTNGAPGPPASTRPQPRSWAKCRPTGRSRPQGHFPRSGGLREGSQGPPQAAEGQP
ncbi:MAG: catechol 2,3-dioxygenase [Actinomycetota bacterium]|nr:catechol 2,3-dioxygenase [Actinomycetota bacterium]